MKRSKCRVPTGIESTGSYCSSTWFPRHYFRVHFLSWTTICLNVCAPGANYQQEETCKALSFTIHQAINQEQQQPNNHYQRYFITDGRKKTDRDKKYVEEIARPFLWLRNMTKFNRGWHDVAVITRNQVFFVKPNCDCCVLRFPFRELRKTNQITQSVKWNLRYSPFRCCH